MVVQTSKSVEGFTLLALVLVAGPLAPGLARADVVTVSVAAGGEVPLPCGGLGPLSPGALVVWEWRPRAPWCVGTDGGRLLEISIRDGRKVVSEQFRGRVLVHPQLIKRGDYTVRLREVRPGDAGDYTCLNQHTGLHRALRLAVNAGCTSNLLVEASPWEGVAEGDAVTLACSYCGPKAAPPRLRWLAGGAPVRGGGDVQVSPDGKTVTIRAAAAEHRARWACAVGKKEGAATAEFCLDVVEYGTTPAHRHPEELDYDDKQEEGEDDTGDEEESAGHGPRDDATQRQEVASSHAASDARESWSTTAAAPATRAPNSAAASPPGRDPEPVATSRAPPPPPPPTTPTPALAARNDPPAPRRRHGATASPEPEQTQMSIHRRFSHPEAGGRGGGGAAEAWHGPVFFACVGAGAVAVVAAVVVVTVLLWRWGACGGKKASGQVTKGDQERATLGPNGAATDLPKDEPSGGASPRDDPQPAAEQAAVCPEAASEVANTAAAETGDDA